MWAGQVLPVAPTGAVAVGGWDRTTDGSCGPPPTSTTSQSAVLVRGCRPATNYRQASDRTTRWDDPPSVWGGMSRPSRIPPLFAMPLPIFMEALHALFHPSFIDPLLVPFFTYLSYLLLRGQMRPKCQS